MSKVENLRQAFSSLLMQYKNKYNKTASAQELVDFAKELTRAGVNVFDSWDNIYDGDGIKGNSVSEKRYYAEGNNLLFETENNEIIAYNIESGSVKIATNKDLATLLDELDGGESGSITEDMVGNGAIDLGKDEVKFFGSIRLLDKNLKTQDNPNQTASISSEDVKKLLDEMVNKLKSLNLASNIKDLAEYVKNNPGADILTSLKNIVKDFILSKFGGSVDNVLKNLTDLNVTQTQLGYLNNIRQQVFDQIVDKAFTSVVTSFEDKPEFANNGTKFDIDEIKSINLSFTVEAGNTLTVEQVDVKSADFLNYLNNLDGDPDIDVVAEDNITIDKDGRVTVRGGRITDTTTQTKDDVAGKFSISAIDVQHILEAVRSGKNEKDAVKEYLKQLFGNSEAEALAKILDVPFSTIGSDYLKSRREAAFDQIATIVLAKVKAAFKDNPAQTIKEMSLDLDNFSGVSFIKDEFANINFGQKVTAADLNDPAFIAYINNLAGRTDITKDNITITDDGRITVNSLVKVDEQVKTEDKSDRTANISSQDTENLLNEMARKLGMSGIRELVNYVKGNPDQIKIAEFKDMIKQFVLGKFGGSVDNVLKNLTDLDISQTESGYVNQVRQQVFNQIINKIYEGVINSYVDKPVSTNNGVELNIDEIKALNLNFTVEAGSALTVGQIDPKNPEFLNYLNNLDGDPDIDVIAEDQITIDPDGKITVKGTRFDTITQTKDGSNGKFSVSAADVQNLLNQMKNASNDQQRDIIRNYLKGLFGNDINTALSKLLDENFSTIGADFLQARRDSAFERVVDIVLEKVRTGFNDADQNIGDVTFDIDGYTGLNFTKDDFKDVQFGQKLTEADLYDPEFIAYVNNALGRTDVTKENISIDSNGKVSVNNVVKVDPQVGTEDKSDRTATMSSQDAERLLNDIARRLGFANIKDFVKGTKTPDQISQAKDLIKQFVLGKFGGSVDNVLKNLTDLDISQTQSGYLNQIRDQVFNQIIDKVYNEVVYSFVDKQTYTKNGIEVNIDEIRSINMNFTSESGKTLTVGQIDTKSAEFLNYLNNIDGNPDIDVTANDEITIDQDGKVTIKGTRVDQTTQTKDDINGKFSVSAADVQKILDEIKAGKDEKTAVSDFLKTLFGNDLNSALAKLLDESFSSVGAGYLKSAREAAFDKVVEKVLAQVKAAANAGSQSINEVTFNLDGFVGINLTKDDFKDISFGQKLTPADLDNPAFIEYVNTLLPGHNFTKDDIRITADGKVSVADITKLDPQVGTEDKSDKKATISSQDAEALLSRMAQAAGYASIKDFIANATPEQINAVKEEIKQFISAKFGGNADAILKNLTDLDITETKSGFLNNIRTQVLDQIVNKVYNELINCYVNKQSSENDGISFNLDEIKSINLDFTQESGRKLTVNQIQKDESGKVVDPEFIDYLKGKGFDVAIGDDIRIAADGSVTVKGTKVDQTTKTADGNNGNLSISAADVQKILDEIKAGKDEKTAVSDFLKTLYGNDLNSALAKLLDESFSSVGAGYLKSARQAALDKVVEAVLAKVKAAAQDNGAQVKDEISYDVDGLNGISITKQDFAGITFGQKLKPEDANDPNFINYLKGLFPGYDITSDKIKIDANGNASVDFPKAITSGAPKLSYGFGVPRQEPGDPRLIPIDDPRPRPIQESLFGGMLDFISKLKGGRITPPEVPRRPGHNDPENLKLTLSGQDVLNLQTQLNQPGADKNAIVKNYLQQNKLSLDYANAVLTAVQSYTGDKVKKASADGIDLNEIKYGDLTFSVTGEVEPPDIGIPAEILSQISQAELNAVKGQDLKAKNSDGTPVFVIAQGSKDGKWHIYKSSHKMYTCVVKVESGNNNLYINNLRDLKEKAKTSTPVILYNCYHTSSPLVLDTDHDGNVEARQGIGVDLNNDGKADGAATGGDKMLAMGDINGDGKITGAEVFGDQTIDPFTGKKLNAANGFEALRMVAESAERHTGIKCIYNGNVDVRKLKKALELYGKGSLGLISGNNVNDLEGLGDIASINVSSYKEQDDSGDMQHRQTGLFTDIDGKKYEIDDIWFRLG